MSVWILIVAASGLGGALVLWQAISRSKYASEVMLRQYSEMLAAARAEKLKRATPRNGEESERAEPEEVR